MFSVGNGKDGPGRRRRTGAPSAPLRLRSLDTSSSDSRSDDELSGVSPSLDPSIRGVANSASEPALGTVFAVAPQQYREPRLFLGQELATSHGNVFQGRSVSFFDTEDDVKDDGGRRRNFASSLTGGLRKAYNTLSLGVGKFFRFEDYYMVAQRYVLIRYSGHGFRHWFIKNGTARRLLWVAIVSYFMYVMVANTADSATVYGSYPKSVTVQVVDEDETEFPAITICNYNALSKSRIREEMKANPKSLRRKLREVVMIDDRFEEMLFSTKRAAASIGRASMCAADRVNWPTPSALVAENKQADQHWPSQGEEDQWNTILADLRWANRKRKNPAAAWSAVQHSHQVGPAGMGVGSRHGGPSSTWNESATTEQGWNFTKPCQLMRFLGLDTRDFNYTAAAEAGLRRLGHDRVRGPHHKGLPLQGLGLHRDGFVPIENRLPPPSQALRCSNDGRDEIVSVNDSLLAEICGKAFYDKTTHRPCLISYLLSDGDPSKVTCFTINRMCDDVRDCGPEDISDETIYCDQSTGRPKCDQVENMKQCDDGTCYDSSWRCNGFEACPDGSDEVGCPEITYDDECECYVRCDTDANGERTSCYPLADEFMESDTLNLERVMWRSKSRNFKTLVDRALSPTPEEIRLFGIRGKDFIVSCSFDGSPCSYKDFYKWQNQDYGNCFTFNSPLLANDTHTTDRNRVTKRYGYKNGLRLNLNIEPDDYLSSITPVKGVRMQIHSRYRVPFPAVLGLDLSTLSKTSIALRKSLIHRAPAPYGRCSRLNEDAFRNRFHYNYSYHACMEICQEVAIRKICGCSKRLNQVFRVQDPPPCLHTNARHRTCLDETITQFNRMDPQVREVAGDGCRRCDPACNEVRYLPHISGAVQSKESMYVFSEVKREFLSGDFCDQTGASKKLKESGTVLVHIYLQNMEQERTVESPSYSFLQFVSSVGGTWGLFAGFSLLTFIEWVELVFYLLGTWLTGIRRDLESETQEVVKRHHKAALRNKAAGPPPVEAQMDD